MHVAILLAAAAAVLSASAADADPVRAQILLAQADTAAPSDTPKPADTAEKKPARKRRKTKKQIAAEKAEALKKAEEAQKAEEEKKAADAKAADAEKAAAEAKAAAETPPPAPVVDAPAADAKPADAPPPAPVMTETAPAPTETPKAPEVTPAAPDAAAAAPAASASAEGDDEAPNLSHTAVTHAPRAKPLHFEARAVDPSGVFQVILYLRRHGGSDYIPFKMNADKTVMGNYSVDLPTALVSTDLEYYVETYDNVGNGPARTGTPERPLQIKLDEPIVPKVEEPKTVLQKQTPPPAITHSSVSKVQKGKSVELVAKMKGTAGVSKPSVKFRQLGSDDWKTLPMGNLGETYTATIPASQTTAGDIEYYVEAYDGSGISASHSASADAPFLIRVADEPVPKPPLVITKNDELPRRRVLREAAPFKANPGQAFGYLALAGAIGGLSFAGGEAYAAWQSNENYQHTLKFEGRNDPALLKRANEYGNRAKTFAIAGGIAAVVATVLLIVFAPGDDAPPPAGSGGDVALFKF